MTEEQILKGSARVPRAVEGVTPSIVPNASGETPNATGGTPVLPKSSLPDGWRWVKLGEIVKRQSSNSHLIKGRLSSSPAPDLFPAYSASGQDVWHDEAEHQGKAIILSAVGARCGKCFLADGEWSAIANTHIIWPLVEQVDVEFLWYLLNNENFWSKDQAIQPFVQVGATLQKEIALPPLAEQKRIAGILKVQMAAVERARASAEAQLQAAEHLPAAYLRAVFNNGISKSWPRKRFGDICEIIAKQVDPKVPEYGALPHVNGENIESGLCRVTYLNTAAQEGMISGKYLFETGDVLYSKLRPYLRKAVVADFRGVCSADMYPLRVNREIIDPQFTAWLLVSDEFTDYADEESRRARMPKLNREQLFAWDAPVPPLADQRRIAAKLLSQMASAERLRQMLTGQLDAINKLPAALLRRAFNGEL